MFLFRWWLLIAVVMVAAPYGTQAWVKLVNVDKNGRELGTEWHYTCPHCRGSVYTTPSHRECIRCLRTWSLSHEWGGVALESDLDSVGGGSASGAADWVEQHEAGQQERVAGAP